MIRRSSTDLWWLQLELKMYANSAWPRYRRAVKWAAAKQIWNACTARANRRSSSL